MCDFHGVEVVKKRGATSHKPSAATRFWLALLFLFALSPGIAAKAMVDVDVLRFQAANFIERDPGHFHAEGEVSVGFVPGRNETFKPLLVFGRGVRLVKGPNDGTFATQGEVYGVAGGRRYLLHVGPFSMSVRGFLQRGAKSLPRTIQVRGFSFTVRSIKAVPAGEDGAVTSELRLQGSLGVTRLAGLSIGVEDRSYVSFSRRGVTITGVALAVNRSFSLGPMQVQAENVKVAYHNPTNTLTLTGSLRLPKLWDATASLPAKGLEIVDGTPKLHGLRLSVEDVHLPVATLKDLEVHYEDGPRGTEIGAVLKLEIPAIFEVDAEIEFVGATPDRIVLAFETDLPSAKIPIGDTGLFFDKIVGGVANLTHARDIEITVAAGIQATDLKRAVAPFVLDGTLKVSRKGLTLDGKCDFQAGSGTGRLDLNWDQGKYEIGITVDLAGGIFEIDADFKVNRDGDFSIFGDATVQVPKAIPVIGGTRLAAVDFYLQVRKRHPDADFVAAWTELNLIVWNPKVGVKYAWNASPKLSFIGASAIDGIGKTARAVKRHSDPATGRVKRFYYHKRRCPVPRGATSLLLDLRWQRALADLRLELTLPDGTKLAQKQFAPAGNGVQLISRRQATTLSLVNPKARGNAYLAVADGTYEVTLITSTDMPDAEFDCTAHYEVPRPVLTADKVEVNGALATIDYTLRTGFPDETRVDWYLDWPDAGSDLLLTTSRVAKSPTVKTGIATKQQTRFDISQDLPLKYGVYGIVKDPVNPPVKSGRLQFEPKPRLSGLVTDQANLSQSGWTVRLGGGRTSRRTMGNGYWGFTHLPAGEHTVELDLLEGWAMRPPSTRTRRVKISGSGAGFVENFQVQRLGVLSGRVFEDLNRNGRFDKGDRPLSHRILHLETAGGGRPQDTGRHAVTGTDGRYRFEVTAGPSYRIRLDQESGWTQTFPFKNGSYDIPLATPGAEVTGRDFGVIHLAEVGGLVFAESGTGQGWNAVDGPLARVAVTVVPVAGGRGITVTSDVDGHFLAEGLEPGTYRVTAQGPPGWTVQHPRQANFDDFGGERPARPGQAVQAVQADANVVAGDFNGDGHPDLAFTVPGTGTVGWLAGAGDGTFGDGGSVTAFQKGPAKGSRKPHLLCADLDHDGDEDLVVLATDLAVLRNDGQGTFTIRETVGVRPPSPNDPNDPGNSLLADVDGDHHPDLVFAGRRGSSAGLFWMRNGGPSLEDPVLLTAAASIKWLVAGDFDGDHDVDFAYASDDSKDEVTVLANLGGGRLGAPQGHGDQLTGTRVGLAAADLDGDGDPDLAVAREDRIVLFVNDGRGSFSRGRIIPEPCKGLLAGDLSSNGRSSLLDPASGQWFRNEGGGRFTSRLLLGSYPQPGGTLADLNGDDVPDLVTVGKDLTVWMGSASGYRHEFLVTLRSGEKIRKTFGLQKK